MPARRPSQQITIYKNVGAGPGASGSVTSEVHGCLGFNKAKVYVDVDQNSASNGLVIEQGIFDPGAGAIDWGPTDTFTVTGGTPMTLEITPIVGEYVRMRYTNGANPTLDFNVLVTLQE